MPDVALLAYPVMLGAMYGAFRVGRRAGLSGRSWIEWMRLCVLAAFLVVVTALQVRFAMRGVLEPSWGVFVGVASLAAILGMLGMQGFEMVEAWEKARGAAAPARPLTPSAPR